MTATCVQREFTVELIKRIPKVELHLHIEGTFEPALMFEIAQRNGVPLKYETVEAIHDAFKFTCLQSFLDVYYQGMGVLLKEQDFFDLTYAYFVRIHKDNVRHTEIFFDPQGHTSRGVDFDTVINGIWRAMKQAETDLGITSRLIMSFLRDMSEEDAFATLDQAMPHLDKLVGVGLDSAEVGHPPSKFSRVFAKCRELGLIPVAHAGEEGPPSYVEEAIHDLKVARIDHGVRALESAEVTAHLVNENMALTVCPLSNLKLKVVQRMEDHNLKRLMENGLRVTINSDDPAYFGGYMTDNYMACFEALGLRPHDIITVSRNAIDASFIPGAEKVRLHRELAQVVAAVEAEFDQKAAALMAQQTA